MGIIGTSKTETRVCVMFDNAQKRRIINLPIDQTKPMEEKDIELMVSGIRGVLERMFLVEDMTGGGGAHGGL